jgi:hypothetical protein
MFQVFHLSFLYIASVTSACFKIRSGVAYRMRVGMGGGMSKERVGRRQRTSTKIPSIRLASAFLLFSNEITEEENNPTKIHQ